MTRSLLLWPTPVLAGIAIALLSVFVTNGAATYGFPLAWKTGGCPPPGIVFTLSCFIAIGYDWLEFGLDALFYTTVVYGLLLAYVKYNIRLRSDEQNVEN
jgi:hypothetical protein